jgi:uncharacterized RDD family membrane protein YckC
MRCPKCHYLGFDPEPRCKNCGYDLEVADADLAMRAAEPADDVVPDLTLHERPTANAAPVTLEIRRTDPEPESAPPQWEPDPEPDWDPVAEPAVAAPAARLSLLKTERTARPAAPARSSTAVDEPPSRMFPPAEAPAPVTRTPFRAPNTTAELPLFVKGIAESESLLDEDDSAQLPSSLALPPARPPLAVRRSAPEPPRARPAQPARRVGPLDHDLLEDLQRVEREEAVRARASAPAFTAEAGEGVDPIHRFAAAATDMVVLGGIATFVFWATLRLCNVSLTGLGVGALIPLLSFLALMDLGYLWMFTAAGGQTVGKMLMGIRVVADDPDVDGGLTLRRAAWRSVLTFVSVGGLGLGWLPALLGRGTLHDRLARTRVVRA